MKILMTADTIGGVWTYALDLIHALESQDVHVTLATMGAPLSADQWKQALPITCLSIRESRYKLEWMDDPWDDVEAAGEWLLALEREIQPDLIHLNGYAHGCLPFRAPVLIAAHSCVLSWWRAVKGEEAPRSWDCYRREVTAGVRGAQRIAAPTGAMWRCIQDHYDIGIHGDVIPNGREPALYTPGEKEPLILSAGRLWDEAKNVAALTAIAADLPWPVSLAGDCRHPDGSDVSLANVNLLGKLAPPDLAMWLGRASIYALPARYEPFGLSALEAALSGCALVLGDIPSLREVWGEDAIFVPPNDYNALRDALLGLIESPERLAAMAEKAHRRARQYTTRRMAEGYMNVYREMVIKDHEESPPCVL